LPVLDVSELVAEMGIGQEGASDSRRVFEERAEGVAVAHRVFVSVSSSSVLSTSRRYGAHLLRSPRVAGMATTKAPFGRRAMGRFCIIKGCVNASYFSLSISVIVSLD
jgi:hypothetical protein